MKIFKEFKEFAIKGNAIDMAVGIIIGAAFGAVVKSLVDDIIMPPFGRIIGGVDFNNLYFNLSGGSYESLAAAKAAGASTLNYGLFINTLLSFLIVSGTLFLMVKFINRLKREQPAKEPDEKDCQYCRSRIAKEAVRCPFCTSDLKETA